MQLNTTVWLDTEIGYVQTVVWMNVSDILVPSESRIGQTRLHVNTYKFVAIQYANQAKSKRKVWTVDGTDD
jgi:hypothetical protein